MSCNFGKIIKKLYFLVWWKSCQRATHATPPPLREPLPVDFPCVGQQVRTASARFIARITRGRGGRAGWFAKRCHSIKDHLIDCKLKTKIANSILLLCYFDKICLILTGGLWQALANLYWEAIKGSRSQWPALSRLYYIQQATPLWRKEVGHGFVLSRWNYCYT
jgi:hypothetical protein